MHRTQNSNDIRVSKVAKLQVRILIIQVAHHQFGWMKMCKKNMSKSSMMTHDIQLMVFVTTQVDIF